MASPNEVVRKLILYAEARGLSQAASKIQELVNATGAVTKATEQQARAYINVEAKLRAGAALNDQAAKAVRALAKEFANIEINSKAFGASFDAAAEKARAIGQVGVQFGEVGRAAALAADQIQDVVRAQVAANASSPNAANAALNDIAQKTREVTAEQARLEAQANEVVDALQRQADATRKNAAIALNNQRQSALKEIAAEERATEQLRATVGRLQSAYDSAGAAEARFAAEKRDLAAALQKGIINQDQYNKTLAGSEQAAKRAREGQILFGKAAAQAGGGIALQSHQMTNLAHQFTDFAVQVGSGGGIFRPLLQQAPQAVDAMGGLSNATALVTGRWKAFSVTTRVGLGLAATAVGVGLVGKSLVDLSGHLASIAQKDEFEVSMRRKTDAGTRFKKSIAEYIGLGPNYISLNQSIANMWNSIAEKIERATNAKKAYVEAPEPLAPKGAPPVMGVTPQTQKPVIGGGQVHPDDIQADRQNGVNTQPRSWSSPGDAEQGLANFNAAAAEAAAKAEAHKNALAALSSQSNLTTADIAKLAGAVSNTEAAHAAAMRSIAAFTVEEKAAAAAVQAYAQAQAAGAGETERAKAADNARAQAMAQQTAAIRDLVREQQNQANAARDAAMRIEGLNATMGGGTDRAVALAQAYAQVDARLAEMAQQGASAAEIERVGKAMDAVVAAQDRLQNAMATNAIQKQIAALNADTAAMGKARGMSATMASAFLQAEKAMEALRQEGRASEAQIKALGAAMMQNAQAAAQMASAQRAVEISAQGAADVQASQAEYRAPTVVGYQPGMSSTDYQRAQTDAGFSDQRAQAEGALAGAQIRAAAAFDAQVRENPANIAAATAQRDAANALASEQYRQQQATINAQVAQEKQNRAMQDAAAANAKYAAAMQDLGYRLRETDGAWVKLSSSIAGFGIALDKAAGDAANFTGFESKSISGSVSDPLHSEKQAAAAAKYGAGGFTTETQSITTGSRATGFVMTALDRIIPTAEGLAYAQEQQKAAMDDYTDSLRSASDQLADAKTNLAEAEKTLQSLRDAEKGKLNTPEALRDSISKLKETIDAWENRPEAPTGMGAVALPDPDAYNLDNIAEYFYGGQDERMGYAESIGLDTRSEEQIRFEEEMAKWDREHEVTQAQYETALSQLEIQEKQLVKLEEIAAKEEKAAAITAAEDAVADAQSAIKDAMEQRREALSANPRLQPDGAAVLTQGMLPSRPALPTRAALPGYAEGVSGRFTGGRPGRDTNVFAMRVSNNERIKITPDGKGSNDNRPVNVVNHFHFPPGTDTYSFRQSEREITGRVGDQIRRLVNSRD